MMASGTTVNEGMGAMTVLTTGTARAGPGIRTLEVVQTEAAQRRRVIEQRKARWTLVWHALAAWAALGLEVAAVWFMSSGGWLLAAPIGVMAVCGLATLVAVVGLTARAVFARMVWISVPLQDYYMPLPAWVSYVRGRILGAFGNSTEMWVAELVSENQLWLKRLADRLYAGRVTEWIVDAVFDPQLMFKPNAASEPLCGASWGPDGKSHGLPTMTVGTSKYGVI
jgi:hypothetical protein